MKVGDKVVCHMEGTVIGVGEYDTEILTDAGETWYAEHDDDNMWKVVDAGL